MEPNYEKVLDAIAELVSAGGAWAEKKAALMSFAEENGYAGDIEEFLGWWDVDLTAPGPEDDPEAA